ncbi:acyltransferase family protein [Phytohabitans flavus]|uniref:acyltransferase family protein n=1 Tax=Phytohabitans flavus TaxID=1076124 RepID=UPI0036260284
MRGLAVAAVLAFHGGIGFMPGGFLGVDVFFVLSGYLITSLLLNEHAGTGTIGLLAFWGGGSGACSRPCCWSWSPS